MPTRIQQRQQEMPPCCLLCIETLDASNITVPRPCCNKNHELCQSCLYRHVMSIIDDEIGQVRTLSCPLGCGTHLTDGEIRDCFRRQHQSWFTNLFRWILSYVVSTCFRSHTVWWYIRNVSLERRDLERYAAWSLQRGLAALRKKEDNFILLQCPGPDCSFQWIVADPTHRRAKQRHEAQSYFLWYAPFRKPESTPSNFVFGPNSFAHLGLRRNADIRRMICPSCLTNFCGLCRNPWVYGTADHSYRACREFMRLPAVRAEESMEDRFALAAFGRRCPGCSCRTERISGCNHIRCPCGVEWCYACGKRWNPTHYNCTDPVAQGAPPCTIL